MKKIGTAMALCMALALALGFCTACGQNNNSKDQPQIGTVEEETNYYHKEDNKTAYTGKVYYVSNSGSDSNDGLSKQTPFASIRKINMLDLNAGDAVLFECGGVYNDAALIIHKSGLPEEHIYISYYGTGAYPVVEGNRCYDEQFELSDDRTATVGIKIESAYNVTVDGLLIENCNFGIFLNNAENNDFTDSELAVNDCVFRNIYGYKCIRIDIDKVPVRPPFYSNVIQVGLRGQTPLSSIKITSCKLFDSEAGMHIDTATKAVLKDVYVDNMFREGILFESVKATESDPSTVSDVTIKNVGVVWGMDHGTAALQFNVCENFICDNLDLSYTGNAEFKNDMMGGDFEATNKNIVVKNSKIHHNGGQAWLYYRTPGWGKDNKNCSLVNNVIYCNGLKDGETAAFLSYHFNTECGGELKDNKIYLNNAEQSLNYLYPTNTDTYPESMDVSGNQVEVYQETAEKTPKGLVESVDFDNAFDYGEWYAFKNMKYAYQNGMYLTGVIQKTEEGEAEIISKKKLKMDLSGAQKISIKLKNKTSATSMKVYLGDEDGRFDDGRMIEVDLLSDVNGFVEYTLPIPFDADKVDRIKIIPAEGATEGWMQFDYIRFYE